MKRSTRSAPEPCAQCGEPIPPGARACPGCGADERTGWRETSIYDGLDLPDDSTHPPSADRSGRLRWWAWLVLVALLAALILGAIGLV